MCKILEDMCKQARAEGYVEGLAEARAEIALRLLASGRFSLEEIAYFSGLPLKDVEKLQNTDTKNTNGW